MLEGEAGIVRRVSGLSETTSETNGGKSFEKQDGCFTENGAKASWAEDRRGVLVHRCVEQEEDG